MKKLVISFFVILAASFSLIARNLSSEEALDQAASFFGLSSREGLSIAWTGSNTNEPSFYVINNRGGGYVVISGTDAINPVLGYSKTNNFIVKGMPSNIVGYFSSIEKDIKVVKERRLRLSNSERGLFNTPNIQTKGSLKGKKYETAQWDQGAPYNNYCIVDGSKKAVTGCVATALAIVLRYNQYPEHGTGSVSDYTTSKGYNMEGYDLSSHVYDWTNMPLTNYDVQRASAEQKSQIAQLMKDCGMLVKMDYGIDASSASYMSVASEFSKHMGYDPASRYLCKGWYSASEWESMLIAELDAGRVILYDGQDSKAGGHAFVVDGYDENGLFSINWGWGGSSNAYYALNLKVGDYLFSQDQSAVFNFKPSGDTPGELTPILMLSGDGTNAGLSLNNGSITKGEYFDIDVKTIWNRSSVAFSGEIVAAVLDESNIIKELISEPRGTTIAGCKGMSYSGANATLRCKIEGDFSFKDKIAIVYSIGKGGNYSILPYNHENGTVGYLSDIPCTFMNVPSSVAPGTAVDLSMISKFSYKSIQWYVDGVPNQTRKFTATGPSHEVKLVLTLSDNTTETIVQEIEVK